MPWTFWLAVSAGLFAGEFVVGARLRMLTLAAAALVVALLTAASLLPRGLPQLVAFGVLALLAFLKLRAHGWARIVSRGRDVEEAAFAGETVVVMAGTREVVTLDEMATWMLQRMDAGKPLSAVAEETVQTFEVTEAQATDDLLALAARLMDLGVLELASEETAP